jgi:hypothetical protein
VGHRPEAAFAFVDDPVPASSRTWVDSDDLHGETVGGVSDDSFPGMGPVRPSREKGV